MAPRIRTRLELAAYGEFRASTLIGPFFFHVGAMTIITQALLCLGAILSLDVIGLKQGGGRLVVLIVFSVVLKLSQFIFVLIIVVPIVVGPRTPLWALVWLKIVLLVNLKRVVFEVGA